MKFETHGEGLVVKLAAVDRLAAGSGPVGEVAALEHKLRHRRHTRKKTQKKCKFSNMGVRYKTV